MQGQLTSLIPSGTLLRNIPSAVSSTSTLRWFSLSSESDGMPLTFKRSEDVPPVLYMYIDESGNLDFGPNGTKYFILTCMVARRPFNLANSLSSFKHDCIEKEGFQAEKFHACQDVNAVKSGVVDLISNSSGVSAYSVYIEKAAVDSELRSPDNLYSRAFECMVSEVYDNEGANAELAVVITDLLPQDAKRSQVTKPLKKFMKSFFNKNGVPYILLHLPSCSDMNLQAADYLCWAYQRKVAQQKDWPFDRLSHLFREVGEVRIATESGDA